MKTLSEYISLNEITNIFEELKVDDKYNYKLVEETDDYNVYFHKHLYKQKSRHSNWNNQNYISDKVILKAIKDGFHKIEDKYNSNKLHYSTNSKTAFLLYDKRKFNNLAIIGFICDLDKDTAKYKICIKTAMYNDEFKAKNNSKFTTVEIILEHVSHILYIEL